MAHRNLPKGRLKRLVRMAGVGARTGVALISKGKSQVAAEKAAEVLGQMRGLAAKVGQMMSYVDGFLPEEHRETFERAMRPLQNAAPRSDSEGVRRTVESELGAPLVELFASFEPEPFASASIGQVHRATLLDGTRVAVKVQHAFIEEAIDSDLKNAGIIESLISTLGPRAVNARDVFEEIERRFREELDYSLEAERQGFFAQVHAGDPTIRIPRVIAERSSRRVLTSEFVAGMTLDEASLGPLEQRRGYAETLWRFVFKGNLVGGMFNADPHPGNYIFHSDNTVTFLDFGCVQPLDPVHLKRARRVHFAALEGSRERFEDSVRDLVGLRGGRYERAALDYIGLCFRPLFESPFHITRDYVAGLVSEIQRLKKFMFTKDKSFVPLPPSMVLMNRLQFGFYSVLARLDTAVDYASVERGFMRADSKPPSPLILAEG